jgi:peroxiredoxin
VTRRGATAPASQDEARATRSGGRAGLVVTVVIAAVLALGAFLLARSQATEPPTLLAVGAQAPPFSLPADGGGSVELTDAPGRPVLVAFVETTCSSCREEAPILAGLARGGTQVIAIDASDSSERERAAFVRDDLEGAVPLAADPEGSVAIPYRAFAVPTVYAVRPDGTIADAWVGRVPAERFEQALAAAAQ